MASKKWQRVIIKEKEGVIMTHITIQLLVTAVIFLSIWALMMLYFISMTKTHIRKLHDKVYEVTQQTHQAQSQASEAMEIASLNQMRNQY